MTRRVWCDPLSEGVRLPTISHRVAKTYKGPRIWEIFPKMSPVLANFRKETCKIRRLMCLVHQIPAPLRWCKCLCVSLSLYVWQCESLCVTWWYLYICTSTYTYHTCIFAYMRVNLYHTQSRQGMCVRVYCAYAYVCLGRQGGGEGEGSTCRFICLRIYR